MCMTCGCGLPHDNHGNSDYLTIEPFEKSAKLDNLRLDEAVKNFIATVENAKKESEHDHR
ncbi:MAG: hypothetical protein ACRDKG_03810 [Actinomycetota bacterium]